MAERRNWGDRPADPSERTATDEENGKAVRGHEDIDKEGHDRGHGDRKQERDGEKGH